MQHNTNEIGPHWHVAGHPSIEDILINASNEIPIGQYRSFVTVRDHLIGAYLHIVQSLNHAELVAIEAQALTKARLSRCTSDRLRLVWLAIACRAHGTRRTSNMFVEYFPKVVHANVFPTAAEKAGPLRVRELNSACVVASAKVGWGRA